VHFPLQESFGLVVAEALARNLKLFAGAAGGVPDVAQGVEAAELFQLGDLGGLESAIARWLQAGCPRPLSARQTICERYHPRVIARQHLQIYREVLAESGKRKAEI
jgi:glycosyltransferase involved in cell wall biosynthesis